jgi:PITH domain
MKKSLYVIVRRIFLIAIAFPRVYTAPLTVLVSASKKARILLLQVTVRFTSPVHVRKIMIIGGGAETQHPSSLKCYSNKEMVDFTNVSEFNPSQVFNLPMNMHGTVELTTVVQAFTNITSLVFYFPGNYGHESTVLKYIGMQGEHTHYRREAVDAVYEVLCNGQDIIQPESDGVSELPGNNSHMH